MIFHCFGVWFLICDMGSSRDFYFVNSFYGTCFNKIFEIFCIHFWAVVWVFIVSSFCWICIWQISAECCLTILGILRVWFWEVLFRFFVWRHHICCIFFTGPALHHGVQLVLGMNQGGNPFTLVETRDTQPVYSSRG